MGKVFGSEYSHSEKDHLTDYFLVAEGHVYLYSGKTWWSPLCQVIKLKTDSQHRLRNILP